jgi:hypothetical protein
MSQSYPVTSGQHPTAASTACFCMWHPCCRAGAAANKLRLVKIACTAAEGAAARRVLFAGRELREELSVELARLLGCCKAVGQRGVTYESGMVWYGGVMSACLAHLCDARVQVSLFLQELHGRCTAAQLQQGCGADRSAGTAVYLVLCGVSWSSIHRKGQLAAAARDAAETVGSW